MATTADEQRFANLSNGDLNAILQEKDSKNTKRNTKTSVSIFRSYLSSKSLDINFELYDKPTLDETLTKFYAEVRQANGEEYKKSSLIGIRHGLNRHLQLNTDNITDIVNGSEFSKSKQMFGAVCKGLKRQGKGGGDHYPVIDDPDLKKMMTYFENASSDNVKLLEKVFVEVMLYFGRRGRENIRDLKVSDFDIDEDSDGNRFVHIIRDELTKNHQNDKNTADGRMYEIKGIYIY